MYTLIVVCTPLLKRFLPNIRNELKKNKEISTKRLIFSTQYFYLVYCKLAVECKRKEILLEYLRKCGKMHFKKTNFDKIALNWFFKTFFLHVFKVCEKEVFHFRKHKDVKNCLFAKTYAPLFLEIILNRIWWLKKTVAAGYFFYFCIHVWMRSKSHQHMRCIFRQKIGNCLNISNRCSFTLRERIENIRMLSTVCGTNFGSFTEINRRESILQLGLKEFFEKSQNYYRSQNVPH